MANKAATMALRPAHPVAEESSRKSSSTLTQCRIRLVRWYPPANWSQKTMSLLMTLGPYSVPSSARDNQVTGIHRPSSVLVRAHSALVRDSPCATIGWKA